MATLKELRTRFELQGDATPSELHPAVNSLLFGGLTERNPGLELANAFSVSFQSRGCTYVLIVLAHLKKCLALSASELMSDGNSASIYENGPKRVGS